MSGAAGIAALLIALAVIGGGVSLGMKRRRAEAAERGPIWRFALLLVLQVAAGLAVWLTLFPPPGGPRAGGLVVATAGAPKEIDVGVGDTLIALPQAGEVTGAERAPDLATALRRHPGVAAIRVVGQGLTARDRAAGVDRAVRFDPPPLPVGVIALDTPGPGAPGTPFALAGRVNGVDGGLAELISPAGEVLARQRLADPGEFSLAAARGVAGVALYQLRIASADERVVETLDVGIESVAVQPPRVRVLAGAPGPEPRFLRDWAERSGVDLEVSYALGADAALGGAGGRLGSGTLGETDVLVVDERRWEALSEAEKSAVRGAVADGMGLLLRPTGPLSAGTRRDWASLGFVLGVGDGEVPVNLTEGEDAAIDPPTLSRRDLDLAASGAVTVASDAESEVLTAWRPVGRGRVGVWTLADSYALVLTGRSDLHARLWAETISALARPVERAPVRVEGWPRQGERLALCDLPPDAELVGPQGVAALIPDSRSGGCAAAWPSSNGWMSVRAGGDVIGSFHAAPTDQGRALTAYGDRQATIALSGEARREVQAGSTTPGSSWPWFATWLALMTALWVVERRRFGPADDAAPVATPNPEPSH
ncbi:hypothetical protein [Brevundimonas lutea]|uniref:hypothetical protein n=1 Tax=Brevundimonas lutea TaxID=2293980 RepID=UPI000F03BF5B|nr:hypothetical protein [Brevundimonas lutea]